MHTPKMIDYIIVKSRPRCNLYNSGSNNIEDDLMGKINIYIRNGYVPHGPLHYLYTGTYNSYCSQVLVKYDEPQAHKYDEPRVHKYNEPRVRKYGEPRVHNIMNGKVYKYNEPRVHKYNEPRVHKYNEPRVHKYY